MKQFLIFSALFIKSACLCKFFQRAYDKYAEFLSLESSVAEPHHFYAAPGENFDAAPAPTLLHSKAKFLKELKFKHMLKLPPSFDSARFILLKI
jgi:hypothetical protein